jgi:NifU-like protein
VELVEVDGKNVYVNMTGACAGCQMAATTLDGIQQRIVEELGEFVRVLPAAALQTA